MRRRTKRSVGVLVSTFCLAVLTTSGSGCAALMMRSPKSKDPAVAPRCSESRAGVAIDGVFTGMYGLTGLALVSSDDVSAAASLPFLALATVHTVSAIAGNRSASRCRNAHTAHEEWLASADTRQRNQDRQTEERLRDMGKRGGACYGNKTCDQGLACVAGTCQIGREPAAPSARPSPAATQAGRATRDHRRDRPPHARDASTSQAPGQTQVTGDDPNRASQPAKPPAAAGNADAKPDAKPGAKKRDDKRDKPERDDSESSPDEIKWSDFWREVRI